MGRNWDNIIVENLYAKKMENLEQWGLLKKKLNKPIGSNKTVANKCPSNKEKPKTRCLSHLILPKF